VAADPAIDRWAEEIAYGEALAVRALVREALVSGTALSDALGEVRCHLARLTPGQHEVLLRAIALARGPAPPG
jgi:hypothetical protein